MPPPLSVRISRTLARVLLASVFLLSGAMKLKEFAASSSKSAGGGGIGGGDNDRGINDASLPPVLAYATRRLGLALASLGAPRSVLTALAPHLPALLALVGVAEAAGAAGLVFGRPWGARVLLALLCIVTPVAHCFWLLPPASAGLELGHAAKNVALAGALWLEVIGGRKEAGGGDGGSGGDGGGGRGGGGGAQTRKDD